MRDLPGPCYSMRHRSGFWCFDLEEDVKESWGDMVKALSKSLDFKWLRDNSIQFLGMVSTKRSENVGEYMNNFDETVWDNFGENGDHFVLQQNLLQQNQWASQEEERRNLQHVSNSSEPLVLSVSQFSTTDSEMITTFNESVASFWNGLDPASFPCVITSHLMGSKEKNDSGKACKETYGAMQEVHGLYNDCDDDDNADDDDDDDDNANRIVVGESSCGFLVDDACLLGNNCNMLAGHQEDAKSNSLLEFGWDHSNSLEDMDTLFRTSNNLFPQLVNESSCGISWSSFPSACGRSSQINMVKDNSPTREPGHPLDSIKLQEVGWKEMPLWGLENRITMALQEKYSINQSISCDEKWFFKDANDRIQAQTEININDGGDMEVQALQEFQSSTAKLDARTRMCIRNALYRMANTATKGYGISSNGDDSHNAVSDANTWNDETYSSKRHSFLKQGNIPSGVFP